eukprot:Polyplicarium_translucidae@DN2667_c0_g1_i2.p2
MSFARSTTWTNAAVPFSVTRAWQGFSFAMWDTTASICPGGGAMASWRPFCGADRAARLAAVFRGGGTRGSSMNFVAPQRGVGPTVQVRWQHDVHPFRRRTSSTGIPRATVIVLLLVAVGGDVGNCRVVLEVGLSVAVRTASVFGYVVPLTGTGIDEAPSEVAIRRTMPHIVDVLDAKRLGIR